jgi:hypothetical protein
MSPYFWNSCAEVFKCFPVIDCKAHGRRVNLDRKGPGIFERGPLSADTIVERHRRRTSARMR